MSNNLAQLMDEADDTLDSDLMKLMSLRTNESADLGSRQFARSYRPSFPFIGYSSNGPEPNHHGQQYHQRSSKNGNKNGNAESSMGNNNNNSQPTRSLFIGNLDPTVGQGDLRTLFEAHGHIESIRLLPNKECAFVNYTTVQEACRARESLTGRPIGHLIPRIGFGRCAGTALGAASFSGGKGNPPSMISNSAHNDGGRANVSRSVWIGQISTTTGRDLLYREFSRFGPIQHVRITQNKSCAFVDFASLDSAIRAKNQMNGMTLGGSIIKTGYAKGHHPLHCHPPTNLSESMLSGCVPSYPLCATNTRGAGAEKPGYDNRSYDSLTMHQSVDDHANYGEDVGMNGRRSSCSNLSLSNQSDGPYHHDRQDYHQGHHHRHNFHQDHHDYHQERHDYHQDQQFQLEWDDDAGDRNAPQQKASYVPPKRPQDISADFAVPLPPHVWDSTTESAVDNLAFFKDLAERHRQPHQNQHVHNGANDTLDFGENGDIEGILERIIAQSLALSRDVQGNIYLQRIIERLDIKSFRAVFEHIFPHFLSLCVDKHGTWVVQRLILLCQLDVTMRTKALDTFRPHLVPLMQDQFGNYVAQCLLTLGPHAAFVLECFHKELLAIGTSRFGARALKNALTGSHIADGSKRHLFRRICQETLTLSEDPHGIILVHWLLDSHADSMTASVSSQLRGHFARLIFSKPTAAIVSRLLEVPSIARPLIVGELFAKLPCDAVWSSPVASAVLVRALAFAGLPAPANEARDDDADEDRASLRSQARAVGRRLQDLGLKSGTPLRLHQDSLVRQARLLP